MVLTLGNAAAAGQGVGCQAVSPDGQSLEGQSLEGQSLDGQSPDGQSPAGHSPQASPPDGQRDNYCAADELYPDAAIVVATFPMPAGLVFDWHTHPDHQLAWAASGVLTVRTKEAAWVLPPTRALWIPAGLRHETLSDGAATMRSAYLRPGLCPITWTEPTPVTASSLLAELIGYLEATDLEPDRRARAEAVLVDLLQPVAMTTIDLRKPADNPARRVADQLAADPADGRTLAEWGREVGASERTLARAFLAGTGISFGRWRTRLRLQAALPELASGEPVANVARHVGYESDSAFVQAFRRETGITPAMFYRGQPGPGAA
jgi:AraC-like DNA-binding protein/quercetin dioxygenase-like cupin family protein